MMRKLESLIPAFLKDYDKHLLLNYPTLWATKIHYLLFGVGISLLLIGLRALLPTIDLASPPDPELWFGITLVPVFIAFLLWAYTASQFEPERYFGITSGIRRFGVQVVYASGIILLAIVPFFYANMLSRHLDDAISKRELIRDVNTLNMGDVFFPVTEHDFRTLPDNSFGEYWYWDTPAVLRTEALAERFQAQSKAEKLQLIADYKQALQKYGDYRINETPEKILAAYDEGELLYAWDYEFDEAITSVHESLSMLTQAKHNRFDFQARDVKQGIAFIVSLIWLLFMIYTRTRGRQFLVSIVSGIAVFIAATAFVVVMHEFLGVGEEIIGLTFMGIFTVLLGQAFFFGRVRTRRVRFWNTIGLALAAGMVPFVPLVLDETMNFYWGESTVIYGGIILSFVCWTLLLNQRFLALQSAPGQD